MLYIGGLSTVAVAYLGSHSNQSWCTLIVTNSPSHDLTA